MIFYVKYALIAAVCVAGMAVVKHYWPTYPDDNVIEEMVERIIDKKFGVDIDITMSSPEKDSE